MADVKILIVNDSATMRRILTNALIKAGYENVCVVSDGKEAFTKLLADTFDLIITDKTMPHMTGFDLAREIKNVRPDIPIILCTGFNDKTDAEKADVVGIKEFIMKPLNKRKIAETIRKVLEYKGS